ncbi:MAG: carboxypeptidase-like regulatory domain-containing protein, partial [Candidatus Stygibacter frigidus]|nr:carboxypeptidase-like regulatory domain-containing protein [Candidatus Stygibacter frigidus]
MINVIKLVIVIAVMFMIFGCTSNDPMEPDQTQTMNDMVIPDGFDWNFTQKVEVILIASDSEGNPVEGANVSLYNKHNGLVFEILTNSDGELRTNIILPESSRSV